MTISEIITEISNYGVLVILAAVFIYIIFKVANILINRFEHKAAELDHDELLDVRFNVGEQIQTMINEALEDFHGSRIQVVEFSNSVMSVAYLPFKYMTCTYEVYSLGKSSSGKIVDHMSTSLFTPFFIQLHDNGSVIIDDSSSECVCVTMSDLMTSCGEKRTMFIELCTSKGKAIGYIALSKYEEFTDEDETELQTLSDRISTLLSVADR